MDVDDLYRNGGVKFYCSGCGKEIEDLFTMNRVVSELIYDSLTGKIYHNSLCKLMDKESSRGKFRHVRYKDLEKLVRRIKLD